MAADSWLRGFTARVMVGEIDHGRLLVLRSGSSHKSDLDDEARNLRRLAPDDPPLDGSGRTYPERQVGCNGRPGSLHPVRGACLTLIKAPVLTITPKCSVADRVTDRSTGSSEIADVRTFLMTSFGGSSPSSRSKQKASVKSDLGLTFSYSGSRIREKGGAEWN